MVGDVGQAPRSHRRDKVLVVDDHKTFTDLVMMALDVQPDFECVGAAHTACAAQALADQHQPDVVLMDVNLKAENGLDLAAQLLAERPELRVVVLTAHGDRRVMRRAALVGACALLPKDGSLPELLEALRAARPGAFLVHPALLHDLVVEDRAPESGDRILPGLTPREQLVLRPARRGARRTPHRAGAGDLGPHLPRARQVPAVQAGGTLPARGRRGRPLAGAHR